jgi:hypothetical protein
VRYSNVLPVVALGAALLACEHEPPLATEWVYESAQLDVFIEPDMPFCRGDGARMDAHVLALSEELEVEPPEKVPVFLVGDDRSELIDRWCNDSQNAMGGCFNHDQMILSMVWALPHELNHAVFHQLNPEVHGISRFWSEAFAVGWETHGSHPFSSSGEILDGQSEQAAYELSAHFVRWLRATRGSAALADFYVSLERGWARADVDVAVADVFGATYQQLLEQYQSDSADRYPGYRWCEDAEVIDVPIGETEVTLRADCDASDTHTFHDSPVEAMHVRRILRLGERSDLHIEYSSPARILRVHPCFDESGIRGSDPRLDGHAWYSYTGSGVPSMAVASERQKVAAGDNLFAFAVPLGAPVELELVITATPSHQFDGEPPPDGQFLLALNSERSPGAEESGAPAKGQVDPGLPMQFILTVDNEGGDHAWEPSFTLQPLDESREPVGEPLTTRDVNVGNAWFGSGLMLEAWIDEGGHLFGNFTGPDALCGTLAAESDLAQGGTFAAIRVEDISPSALPPQFPTSCDELP